MNYTEKQELISYLKNHIETNCSDFKKELFLFVKNSIIPAIEEGETEIIKNPKNFAIQVLYNNTNNNKHKLTLELQKLIKNKNPDEIEIIVKEIEKILSLTYIRDIINNSEIERKEKIQTGELIKNTLVDISQIEDFDSNEFKIIDFIDKKNISLNENLEHGENAKEEQDETTTAKEKYEYLRQLECLNVPELKSSNTYSQNSKHKIISKILGVDVRTAKGMLNKESKYSPTQNTIQKVKDKLSEMKKGVE